MGDKIKGIGDITVGGLVTYCPDYGEKEHGIVKAMAGKNYVFVVYNWGDNIENYSDYTGQRTRLEDLRKGWI